MIRSFRQSGSVQELVSFTFEPHACSLVPLDIRKQSIFWLGQNASRKIAGVLSDITYDTASFDIQREAVFALSQSKHYDSIPLLIEIAHEHPSSELRKQAVFWLSQCNDPRAIDDLVTFLRE